jgi:2-polyprenyl-6-methoxyphenol hydroxylase-like FAD-dependent oxidoreductase
VPSETAQSDVERSDTQVLIVGAGPAGLFVASELLRHGIKPRIVEQKPGPHHETRGTAIQPAVLEVLDKGALIAPFLSSSLRIHEVELLGPELKQIGLTELAGMGANTSSNAASRNGLPRRRCAITSWGTAFKSSSASKP